jgi:hypothetical protein
LNLCLKKDEMNLNCDMSLTFKKSDEYLNLRLNLKKRRRRGI